MKKIFIMLMITVSIISCTKKQEIKYKTTCDGKDCRTIKGIVIDSITGNGVSTFIIIKERIWSLSSPLSVIGVAKTDLKGKFSIEARKNNLTNQVYFFKTKDNIESEALIATYSNDSVILKL